MPPWLDSAEEVGAVGAAVLTGAGAIAVAGLGVVAALVAVWRSKVKPILTQTHTAATSAADQLTPNHGSSARDALGRIERAVEQLDRNTTMHLSDIRADMRADRDAGDRIHADLGRRMRGLESPQENTR